MIAFGGCTSAGRRVLMAIEQTWKSPKLFDRQISAIKEETKNAKNHKKTKKKHFSFTVKAFEHDKYQ